jgi:hypothetical protein
MHFRLACSAAPLRSRYCTARVSKRSLNIKVENAVDRAWKKFYAKYPGSTGILFFSKAGFNSKMTQAFIYAGRQCGGLCGFGKYILLEKKGSAWTIKNEMQLWVS